MERVSVSLSLRHLSASELRLFVDQAAGLSSRFTDRPGVADLFALIGIMADWWRTEGDLQGMGGSAPTDPTAPLAHQADDIACVMAYAMAFVDDSSLSPAIRGAWNDVLRSLSREIRRRYGA